MGPLTILHITNALELGGAVRNIHNIARHLDFGVFRHEVCALFHGGDRLPVFRALGIPTEVLGGRLAALADVLTRVKPAVVMIHRAGRAEAHWSRVLRQVGAVNGVLIVEVNVFGLVDTSAEDALIDLHCHKSKTSYLAFLRRANGVGYPRVDRHCVSYNCTDVLGFVASEPSHPERVRIRATLGLGEDDFVLLRVGRPDVRKWSDFIFDALPELFAAVPQARFVFLGMPRNRRSRLMHERWGARCVLVEPTEDDRKLASIYYAADVLVHSSRRGETFPNTIVEAMACARPVVTNSTPWADNAQIEFVDHGSTGYVVGSPSGLAGALSSLYVDRELRARFGSAARAKALRECGGRHVAARLARRILSQLGDDARMSSLPGDGEAMSDVTSREEYDADYASRLQAIWDGRPPVRGGWWVERAVWTFLDALEVVRYKWEDGSWRW